MRASAGVLDFFLGSWRGLRSSWLIVGIVSKLQALMLLDIWRFVNRFGRFWRNGGRNDGWGCQFELNLLLGRQAFGAFAVDFEAGADGDEAANDDVLLEAAQLVGLAPDGRSDEHAGGVLEAGRG